MKKVTKKDVVTTIAYLSLYILVLIVGAILFIPNLFIIWLFIAVAGLVSLVMWHSDKFAYHCSSCSEIFSLAPIADFIHPQLPSKHGGVKYLKCPKCGKRHWAEIVHK